jgi:hypothetical protein
MTFKEAIFGKMSRAFAWYLGVTGSYGFYRGWNNLYNRRDFGETQPLYTDRVMSGVCGAITQANPVLFPLTLIFAARRLEMRARGKEITKEDYEW